MYVTTYDGDRVGRYDRQNGHLVPYRANVASVSDAHIRSLMEAGASGPGSPRWEEAQLCYQPGFYGASTAEVDRIVDLVRPLDKVLGAGLMGAGGRGCMPILARAGSEALSQQVTEELCRGYYEPLGKPIDVEPSRPTAPAGKLVLGSDVTRQVALEPPLAQKRKRRPVAWPPGSSLFLSRPPVRCLSTRSASRAGPASP